MHVADENLTETFGIDLLFRRRRLLAQMNEFASGGVPPSTLETAAREATEYALNALCAHVRQSRAQLLAANRLDWDGKGIGGDLRRVQGVAVLLKRSRALT